MMTYAMKATEMPFAQKYYQNQRGEHRSLRQTSLRHHARNNGQYIPHRSENRQPSDHLRTDSCMKFAQMKSMLIIQLKKTTEILTQWFLHAFKRTLFFFFLSELLFQTADLFHQLRQVRECSLDSPPLGVGSRRIAEVGAWGLDGTDDACLASEDSVVTDGDMAIHAGLSGHDDVIADLGAAGDADLRAEEIVLADFDIVSQVTKVIDLGAAADDGIVHRTVVDGGAGADLDVVSDDSAAELTDVMVMACLVSGEAEALTADDGMRTKDDAVA